MKFFLTIAVIIASTFALAVSAEAKTKNYNSNNASAVAVSQNKNSVRNSVNVERSVSSAVAPGLAAGGISCSQSAGIGVSTAGFSISAGGTRQDVECDLRQWTSINNQLFGGNAARRTACKSRYNRDEPYCAAFNGRATAATVSTRNGRRTATAAVASSERRVPTWAEYFGKK